MSNSWLNTDTFWKFQLNEQSVRQRATKFTKNRPCTFISLFLFYWCELVHWEIIARLLKEQMADPRFISTAHLQLSPHSLTFAVKILRILIMLQVNTLYYYISWTDWVLSYLQTAQISSFVSNTYFVSSSSAHLINHFFFFLNFCFYISTQSVKTLSISKPNGHLHFSFIISLLACQINTSHFS